MRRKLFKIINVKVIISRKKYRVVILVIFREFQPMASDPNDSSLLSDQDTCHQTKTPISFWYRQGLNPRSLIQPSKTIQLSYVKK